jgi:outer membrane protein OmpA-like peptidoglycan-associated protein
VDYDLPGGNGTFARIRQFSAYGSYLFDLSDSWDIEPFALVRNQGPGSFQYELNALTSWKQTLFLGVGYRQAAGFIGRLGFQITDHLIAAYAYEFSNSGIVSRSSGSHEFMVGYKVNRPKKDKSVEKVEEQKSEEKLAEKPVVKQEKVEEEMAVIEDQVALEVKPVEEVEPIEIVVKQENPVVVEKTIEKKEKLTTVESTKTVFTPAEKEILSTKVVFEFEKSTLSDETRNNLDKMVKVLNDNPNAKVIVEGHTCNMGSDEVNTRYSLLRANKVKDYFLNKNVNPAQIETKAMRDTQPLVPNTSIANREKNRRVEIEIVE